MQTNFTKKTELLFAGMSKNKIDSIVTMASIVEREAVGNNDNK